MAKRNSIFFEKKEDALPFFSVHPSTKIGRILRILLAAFFIVAAILILLANAGLTFIKFYDLYYLIYLVPSVIIMALVIVALYKRMNRLISKILVCGSIGFLVISLAMTIGSMNSMLNQYAWSVAMGMNVEGAGNIVMMRTCISPDSETKSITVVADSDLEHAHSIPAYKYTAITMDGFGKSEGEIIVSSKSDFVIKGKWIGDNKCYFYLAQDSEGYGYGEITVTFDGQSTNSIVDNAAFRSSNTKGLNTVNLYREDIYIIVDKTAENDADEQPLQYPYHLASYKYTATPSDGIGKVEGAIQVAAVSKFNIEVEWIDENKCRYYLSEDSEGHGSGEIIVTFDGTSKSEVSEKAIFRSSSKNGSNTVNLYREESYIETTSESIYFLTEECFEREYRAYPTWAYYFVKTSTLIDGKIVLEPFGTLNSIAVDASKLNDGILILSPGDSCEGANGEITIYLNEKETSFVADTSKL